MITDRIFTPGLAQVAYMVADEEAGVAAIIDPRRDVDEYVQWAEERGLEYVAILETHVHADFVSGALELAAVTGAPIYASRLGESGFDHIPVDDGDIIEVGSVRLKALFTPGHTPEHMAYLLLPSPDSDVPTALYSGDVLFVGDVGRPDLLGEKETRGLAEKLFTTVNDTLKSLPDDVVVYPGHTAGSACGKKIGDAPSTTIRAEKMGNYAFQPEERDEFIETVLADMPTPPTYYPYLKKINKVGAVKFEALDAPDAMSAADVKAAMEDGTLVVDTRTPEEFGEGHIPGSMFAGAGESFHTWMGWVAPFDRDVVIVGGGEWTVDELVTALRQIGLDRVAGHLEGGIDAWTGELETTPMISVEELSENLDDYQVLDVRNESEWKDGHIESATLLPADEITRGAKPEGMADDTPIALICGSGFRSSVASSLLQARGMDNLVTVKGGMEAWDDLRLAVTA
jgi:hydroxyacylglutathione hydrolase